MDLKSTLEIAASLAGLVSTSLEIQRRVSDYRSNARTGRLRARAEELAKFLQIQTELHSAGADERLTQQALSATKVELEQTLQELVRIQQTSGVSKLDEMSLIRRGLLLFVPARSLAWILHFGFYFSVFFLGLSVLEIKEVSRSKLLPDRYIIASEISSCIMVAVFLRHWALMEKRWAEGFRPSPSSMSRKLLWHLPASRRELIARAALVFGFCQFVPFFLTSWISIFRESLSFVQILVTIIVFYAWSLAELNLAADTIELKFPYNLRFLNWPRNLRTWVWTICFYFMAGSAIFVMKQIATANILPAEYKKLEFIHVAAIVGLIIGLLLSYVLPMYAVNRILLAQSATRAHSASL